MESTGRIRFISLVLWLGVAVSVVTGQDLDAIGPAIAGEQIGTEGSGDESAISALEQAKREGARRSGYRRQSLPAQRRQAPEPQLATYQQNVEPLLRKACVACHGPEVQEGNVRIDTLDPDLVHGSDVPWWLEVFAVLSNGEMPPPEDGDLSDDDRSRIIDWLSSELQTASEIRRGQQQISSFRRMTRYEYNYAMQDLLGLPYNFAKDLPPDPNSEGGFQNSSETLHMSAVQLETYRQLGRQALRRATVRGEQPESLYWGISMQTASADQWKSQEAELEKLRQSYREDPARLQQELEQKISSYQVRHGRAHYKNLANGRTAVANWSYPEAKYAWKPSSTRPEIPQAHDTVAVIPARQGLIVELGDRVPEEGNLRVRFRASRTSSEALPASSIQLVFGWQASNDSHASVRISDHDLAIDAPPDQPTFYQWEIPLSEIYPRNSVRNVNKLGDLPNPSEYIKFVNSSVSEGDIQIDYIEVTAPVYDRWPPDSHTRIFIDRDHRGDETVYAREILADFMPRAWRRPVQDFEVERKLEMFGAVRPECDDFQEAMLEVLAAVIASPRFLYIGHARAKASGDGVDPYELATRMSMFLWSSSPDQRLMELAKDGQLSQPAVLETQVARMLADERSRRLSEHFVRQWLGMQLLDYLKVDRKVYPEFDPALHEAMQAEPIAFFHEILQRNHSVMDFLHADYTMVNERLAKHYGLEGVVGNHFRRASLPPQLGRGGVLAQAGLLAMNSDGKDSHPLKRGIWILERLLDDPPPPPPPAVPRIDLADPEIAKLTLKQRMANHRDQAACRSCHLKIDPWGIALENFDAVGRWRSQVGDEPVDATSVLFNNQKLDGVAGLKRFLLASRQDQFARAIALKLTTYAIGRPLTFADHAEIDRITASLRQQGDGLATLVMLIVKSDLFQSES